MDNRSFGIGLAAGLAVAIAVWYQGQLGATLSCGKAFERDMRENSQHYLRSTEDEGELVRHQRWGASCQVLDAANMSEAELFNAFHMEAIRPNRPIVIANYSFNKLGNLSRWSNVSYLLDKFGDTIHRVQFGRESRRMIFAEPKSSTLEHPYERIGVPLSESISMIEGSQGNVFLTQIPLYSPAAVAEAAAEEPETPIDNGEDDDVGGYSEMGIPPMYDDIGPIDLVDSTMATHSVNFWMSRVLNGTTRESTFHFDPSDNFLVMVAGTKEAVLVSSLDSHWVHPKRLFATRYQTPPGQPDLLADVAGRMDPLSDETRDNFSPVDMKTPDLERFPLWGEAEPTRCSIHSGEMLWIPAFTWHNILSKGDPEMNWLNVAVNYWYEPIEALADYMRLIHEKILDANDYA